MTPGPADGTLAPGRDAVVWWIWAPIIGCRGGADVAVVPSVCDDQAGSSFCDGAAVVDCTTGIPRIEGCDSDEVCDPVALDCVPCAVDLQVPHSNGDSAVFVAVDDHPGPFDQRRLRMRPIEVQGVGPVTIEGPIQVYRSDGTEVVSADLATTGTLLVHGIDTGIGRVEVAGCDGTAVVEIVVGRAPLEVAGRGLTGAPWFEDPDLFDPNTPIEVAVDGRIYTDRVGLSYDVAVVPHRDPAAWAADPSLDPVVDPVRGTVGDLAAGTVLAVQQPLSPDDLVTAYDVVLDFGQDGTLDPGDLIDGFDAPGLYVARDLAEPGPYTPGPVLDWSVDFWHTMVIYRPEELDQLDPVPIVGISHGNGHDYDWYDYLGNHLASHGYVVFSHRNDTQPGTVTAASSTWQNTDVFLDSLDAVGLAGEVDPNRIVWIGHSRGAEGVAIAKHWLHTGRADPMHYGADDVVLVSSIAPVVFQASGPNVANPHDTPYHQLCGSADGDVTGAIDNPEGQWFRIFGRASGERLVTYVQGATHNDFNCCGFDDSIFVQGPGVLIGRPRAQRIAKSYYLAILESQLGDWPILGEYLVRPPERFRPPQANAVISTLHRRAPGDRTWVVDDFESQPEPDRASSGGAVTTTLVDLFEGELDDANQSLSWNPSDPMNGMTWSSTRDDHRDHGIVFTFNEGETHQLEFALPPDWGDLTPHEAVSFRAAQGTRHPNTFALDGFASFSVALVDAAGTEAAVDHGRYGGLPSPYPRHSLFDGGGEGWINEFQTVRIPLAAFAAVEPGLDLANVTAIRFLFGAPHGSAMGRVGLDDIEILHGGVR